MAAGAGNERKSAMRRIWLAAAGLGGFGAVLIGAVTDHIVTGNTQATRLMNISSQFAMYHSLGLLALVVLSERLGGLSGRLIQGAAWLFIAGIILFSGSLVTLALTPFAAAAYGAPFGGTAFMLGWLCLIGAALKARAWNL